MNALRVGKWSLDWAARGRGLEEVSGDLHVVAPFREGVLVANIDGLGHGPQAARVSRTIATVLEEHPHEELERLVDRCHEAARGTRGAVLTIASFTSHDSQLSWCGIGNVEGRLFRSVESPLESNAVPQRGGVVGFRIPRLKTSSLSIRNGDVLVLATDGISTRLEEDFSPGTSASEMANYLLEHYALPADDALTTVVRFSEEPP